MMQNPTFDGPLLPALLIFIAGMSYRLVRVIMLGWSKDNIPPMGSKATGVIQSYLKGLLVFPFIPWVKNTFSKNPVIYLAGGLFHLSLFVIIFLGAAHMLVWKSLLGFGWSTLPFPIVDWMTTAGIIAMIALLIHRLTNPVLKLISGVPEWLNWLFVFLPLLTGYLMAHHLWLPYEQLFKLHKLTISILLVWIPFSRISHFMFYFFSRTIHGQEFGKRGVRPWQPKMP